MSICLYVGKNVSVDVLLRKKRRFGEIAPFWDTAVLASDFAPFIWQGVSVISGKISQLVAKVNSRSVFGHLSKV